MQNSEHFGALLRASRLKAGWTLARLADYLGVSIPYLSEVERSHRAPLTVDRVRSAAAALGVDPAEFQKAAGVSRGAFALPAGPTPLHVDVGAELAEQWPGLSEHALKRVREALYAGERRAADVTRQRR